MTPKNPQKTTPGTAPKTWRPPRGIRYEFRADRPTAPFYLLWRDGAGKRKKQAFEDEQTREDVARDLVDKRAEHGTAIFDFDHKKWRRWLEFERMVGDTDPLRVAAEWLAAQTKGGVVTTRLTVAQAWTRYRAMRIEEEKLSPDTWRHIDKHVGSRFVGVFGKERLHDIDAGRIRDWMRGLTHPRTGVAMEALTQRHHRKDVNSFFDRCLREGWLDRNPCDLVSPPKFDGEGDVTVMPVKDAFEFFKANRDEPAIVRVAMEAFGGLRYSTAGRVGHAHVNFEERGIEMPGAMHKSGKRKFRQGHPDCLWAWLELAQNEKHDTWALSLRQYAEAKKLGRVRAKVETPHNVWRHSFASYLLAKTKSLPTVGYLMQHRHTSTTEIYEGVAKERDAALYFAITPEAVKGTWEEFSATV